VHNPHSAPAEVRTALAGSLRCSNYNSSPCAGAAAGSPDARNAGSCPVSRQNNAGATSAVNPMKHPSVPDRRRALRPLTADYEVLPFGLNREEARKADAQETVARRQPLARRAESSSAGHVEARSVEERFVAHWEGTRPRGRVDCREPGLLRVPKGYQRCGFIVAAPSGRSPE
jgi:hypothetical protein